MVKNQNELQRFWNLENSYTHTLSLNLAKQNYSSNSHFYHQRIYL